MRMLLSAFAAISLLVVGLAAQTPAPVARPSIAVYGGALVYNDPDLDTMALVEFPFSLNRSDFEFFRPDSADPSFYARIFAQVVVLNSAALPVDSVNTYFSVRAASLLEAKASGLMIFNKLVMLVKPGVYTARLTVIDAVNKQSEELVIGPFSVAPPQHDHLQIAGACLAHRVSYVGDSAAEADDRMVKNHYLVLPSPIGAFSVSDSIAYIYAELYNLKSVPNGGTFAVAYTVLDDSANIYRDFGLRTVAKPGASAVLTDALDIRGWPRGQYKLRIVVADPDAAGQDTVLLPLRIINTDYLRMAAARPIVTDAYDSLSSKDKMNLIAYLLTPNEKATFDRLSDSGRLNFLDQYWRDYRARPIDLRKVERAEYVRRYLFAQQNFSTDGLKPKGWSSDRGRIYILYGPWDEKNEVQAPRYGNPFVIWYYRGIKEGKLFVFEDQEGFHDFKLVHSNVQGERNDSEWADRLHNEMLDVY
jgi:GWxTD domain-containing protein